MNDSQAVTQNTYRQLAEALDALPNGFPPTADGTELRLLAKLFTPAEAELAAQLLPDLETPPQMAARTGINQRELYPLLKEMTRKGLIQAGRTESDGRLGFGLMPFVVGIYEAQANKIDAEMAALFETYYHQAFGSALSISPQVHRVIPIGESLKSTIEIRPYESASDIIANAQSWGVVNCICREQKALIGDPCDHPLEVCMILSQSAGAFDNSDTIRALTQEEAYQVLKIAADAGLVHSVSNNQQGLWYICNCCTCSCGILRGMADLGIANVIARSAFVNQVNQKNCIACGECVETCQFNALSLQDTLTIDSNRCVGCGVCVPSCPQDALFLIRRPTHEIEEPPPTYKDWQKLRTAARNAN